MAIEGSPGWSSDVVFEKMLANIKADPAVLKKVNGCLAFKITGPDGKAKAAWTVDAKVGVGTVAAAEPAEGKKADVTIIIGDADLVKLASGELKAMSAYMSGKLKLQGKAPLAQKLAALMGGAPKSKL